MSEIITYDVGSLPNSKFELSYTRIRSDEELNRLFIDSIVKGFVDKAMAGIDIPNYPQYRSMIDMFIEMIGGIEKIKTKFASFDKLVLKEWEIPEVRILRERIREIYDDIGGKVRVKICITGPYTLSALFINRSPELIITLSNLISEIAINNIFKGRYGEVSLVTIDEPTFGFLDDPLIEYGSEGREALLKGWEEIFRSIKLRNVTSSIHLHNTSDPLFWHVDSLQIIESHVNDHIYYSKKTRKLLEERDKFLKASICATDFNDLIIRSLHSKYESADIPNILGKVWREIKRGVIDPIRYLESTETMQKRLSKIISHIGIERIRYAGPECGLKNFPTYEAAIECLRRVVIAVKTLKSLN